MDGFKVDGRELRLVLAQQENGASLWTRRRMGWRMLFDSVGTCCRSATGGF